MRTARLTALLLTAALVAFGQASVASLGRRGNGLYAQGKYDDALEFYQQAGILEPDATTIRYNTGNTLHRLGRYDEAVPELELALTDKTPRRRADAMYNIGNTHFRAGRLDAAIASYVSTLVMNPSDRAAKENLEFALKKKKEMEKQQQNQSKSDDQQKEQQQQPQPKPEMSRDEAERMIQAVENKEKEEQQKQQAPRQKRQVERDW